MPKQVDTGTVDAVVEALGNARRRYVLYYVRDRETVAIDDLVTAVARWVSAGPDDATPGPCETLGPCDHERARATLHHHDLPKLSDVELVSVDREAETVTFVGEGFALALLDLVYEYERGSVSGSGDSAYRGV